MLLGRARIGDLRIDVSDEILNEIISVLRDKLSWIPCMTRAKGSGSFRTSWRPP